MTVGSLKRIGSIVALSLILSACGSEGVFSKDAIQGKWKMTTLEAVAEGKSIKASLTDDPAKATADQARLINLLKQFTEFRVEGNDLIAVSTRGTEDKQTFKDDGTFDDSDGNTGIHFSEATSTALVLEMTNTGTVVRMGFTR